MRKVVVLPQPDGPSKTTYSPWSMWRLKSSTATVPPGKTLVRFTRSSPDDRGREGAAAAAPSTIGPALSSAIRYALRNSFTFFTWYRFSVKKEFHDE